MAAPAPFDAQALRADNTDDNPHIMYLPGPTSTFPSDPATIPEKIQHDRTAADNAFAANNTRFVDTHVVLLKQLGAAVKAGKLDDTAIPMEAAMYMQVRYLERYMYASRGASNAAVQFLQDQLKTAHAHADIVNTRAADAEERVRKDNLTALQQATAQTVLIGDLREQLRVTQQNAVDKQNAGDKPSSSSGNKDCNPIVSAKDIKNFLANMQDNSTNTGSLEDSVAELIRLLQDCRDGLPSSPRTPREHTPCNPACEIDYDHWTRLYDDNVTAALALQRRIDMLEQALRAANVAVPGALAAPPATPHGGSPAPDTANATRRQLIDRITTLEDLNHFLTEQYKELVHFQSQASPTNDPTKHADCVEKTRILGVRNVDLKQQIASLTGLLTSLGEISIPDGDYIDPIVENDYLRGQRTNHIALVGRLTAKIRELKAQVAGLPGGPPAGGPPDDDAAAIVDCLKNGTDLKKQIAKLKRDINKVRKVADTVPGLQRQIGVHEADIKALEDLRDADVPADQDNAVAINKLKKLIRDLKTDVAMRDRIIEETEHEAHETSGAAVKGANQVKRRDNLIVKLRAEIAQLMDDVDTAQTQISAVRLERNLARNERDAATATAAAANQQIAGLTCQTDRLKRELEDSHAGSPNVVNPPADQADVAELNAQVAVLNQQILTLQAQLDQSRNAMAIADLALRKKEKELADLTSKKAQLLQDIQAVKDNSGEIAEDLRHTIQELQDQNQALQKQIGVCRADTPLLDQNAIDTLTTERDTLRNNITRLNGQIATLRKELDRYLYADEDPIDQHNTKITELTAEKTKLQQKLDARRKENADNGNGAHDDEVESLNNKIAGLEARNDSLQQQFNDCLELSDDDPEDIQDKIDRLETQVHHLAADRARIQALANSATLRADTHMARLIVPVTSPNEALISGLQAEVKDLNAEKDGLNSQLQEFWDDLLVDGAPVDGAKSQIAVLEREKTALQKKLDDCLAGISNDGSPPIDEDDCARRIAALQKTIRLLNARLVQANGERDSANAFLAIAQKDLKSSRDANAAAARGREILRNIQLDLQEKSTAATAAYKNACKTMPHGDDELKRLKHEYKRASMTYDSARTAYVQARDGVDINHMLRDRDDALDREKAAIALRAQALRLQHVAETAESEMHDKLKAERRKLATATSELEQAKKDRDAAIEAHNAAYLHANARTCERDYARQERDELLATAINDAPADMQDLYNRVNEAQRARDVAEDALEAALDKHKNAEKECEEAKRKMVLKHALELDDMTEARDSLQDQIDDLPNTILDPELQIKVVEPTETIQELADQHDDHVHATHCQLRNIEQLCSEKKMWKEMARNADVPGCSGGIQQIEFLVLELEEAEDRLQSLNEAVGNIPDTVSSDRYTPVCEAPGLIPDMDDLRMPQHNAGEPIEVDESEAAKLKAAVEKCCSLEQALEDREVLHEEDLKALQSQIDQLAEANAVTDRRPLSSPAEDINTGKPKSPVRTTPRRNSILSTIQESPRSSIGAASGSSVSQPGKYSYPIDDSSEEESEPETPSTKSKHTHLPQEARYAPFGNRYGRTLISHTPHQLPKPPGHKEPKYPNTGKHVHQHPEPRYSTPSDEDEDEGQIGFGVSEPKNSVLTKPGHKKAKHTPHQLPKPPGHKVPKYSDEYKHAHAYQLHELRLWAVSDEEADEHGVAIYDGPGPSTKRPAHKPQNHTKHTKHHHATISIPSSDELATTPSPLPKRAGRPKTKHVVFSPVISEAPSTPKKAGRPPKRRNTLPEVTERKRQRTGSNQETKRSEAGKFVLEE